MRRCGGLLALRRPAQSFSLDDRRWSQGGLEEGRVALWDCTSPSLVYSLASRNLLPARFVFIVSWFLFNLDLSTDSLIPKTFLSFTLYNPTLSRELICRVYGLDYQDMKVVMVTWLPLWLLRIADCVVSCSWCWLRSRTQCSMTCWYLWSMVFLMSWCCESLYSWDPDHLPFTCVVLQYVMHDYTLPSILSLLKINGVHWWVCISKEWNLCLVNRNRDILEEALEKKAIISEFDWSFHKRTVSWSQLDYWEVNRSTTALR